VSEAISRGHTVTVVSRSLPDAPVEGVTYITGSALEADVLAKAFDGADAVVTATTSRGEASQAAPGIAEGLVKAASASGTPIFVVGGFSSLRPAAGEPRVIEGEVPEQYLAEAQAGQDALDALLAAPSDVKWTFFSPAAHYGSWVEGEASGAYKLGGEVMILDPETGTSYLHADDLADAILDVIESEQNSRGHVSVVS